MLWHSPGRCPHYREEKTRCKKCQGRHRSHLCSYENIREKYREKWKDIKKHSHTSLNNIQNVELFTLTHKQTPPTKNKYTNEIDFKSEEPYFSEESLESYSDSEGSNDLWEEENLKKSPHLQWSESSDLMISDVISP